MLADELRSLEAISLHRVGDFYEIYGEEAKAAAQILELQLTYKEKNGERTDLVGIPAHALEKYVTKLQEENVFVIFPDVEVSERLNIQEENITEDAEIIAPEETMEEASTTQGPLWDEGTAMRIAKEEWDKAHKPPKPQLTLRQRNYEAIYKIAPEILDGDRQAGRPHRHRTGIIPISPARGGKPCTFALRRRGIRKDGKHAHFPA